MRRVPVPFRLAIAAAMLVTIVSTVSSADFRLRSFPIPTGNSQPIDICLGPDGNLWFVEQNASRVARVTPKGTITEFATRTLSFPNAITPGPDGNVWFTGGANGTINRVRPNGRIREFVFDSNGLARGITTGPDGAIWFTDSIGNAVWRFDIATETFTSFPIPTPNSFPGFIKVGSDGNLWFLEGVGKIAKITTDGVITELPQALEGPQYLALGPDGNMWCSLGFVGTVGKVTPDGVFTFYETGLHTLEGIIAGPDGNMWFTSFGDSKIASITTDGVVDPSDEIRDSQPTGITVGPVVQGRPTLWFLGYGNDRVYRAQL